MADDEDDDDRSRARPFWSGTIAFGLVSLPVSLYAANRGRAISLKMVDEDGTPLARRYFCEQDGEPVDYDQLVRGYRLDDGRWLTIEDDELEALAPNKSREIDLRKFVRLDDIDPMYFERAYYLIPEEGATKAYRLLAQSMEAEGRAGIATFVMREREYLCAIVAERGILRAETLRFHEELRTPEYIGLPKAHTPPKARVDELREQIDALAADDFDRDELTEGYVKRLRRFVHDKLDAGRDVVEAPEPVAADARDEDNVIDLMQMLKARLQGKDAPATRKRRARDAADDDGPDAEALDQLTKDELYDRAQALDIAGRSRMSKAELVEALRRH